jgi:hypothetical protein
MYFDAALDTQTLTCTHPLGVVGETPLRRPRMRLGAVTSLHRSRGLDGVNGVALLLRAATPTPLRAPRAVFALFTARMHLTVTRHRPYAQLRARDGKDARALRQTAAGAAHAVPTTTTAKSTTTTPPRAGVQFMTTTTTGRCVVVCRRTSLFVSKSNVDVGSDRYE